MNTRESLLTFIKTDRSHGARELALIALRGIRQIVSRADETDPQVFRGWIRSLVREIGAARPSMIPIVNAMVLVGNSMSSGITVDRLKEEVRDAIDELEERIETALDKIVAHGLRYFRTQKFRCVLTHSSGSTVKALLLAAAEENLIQQVIVTESRPLYEGVDLARELSSVVEVILITEAQIAQSMTQCDAVVLGVDAIGKDLGFINKVGSRLVALSAGELRKPVIFAGETIKVHPTLKAAEIPLEEAPPEELGHDLPERIQIRNVYFETVERELVNVWISEEGIHHPNK